MPGHVVPFVENYMKTGKIFILLLFLLAILALSSGCNKKTKDEEALSPHLVKMYKRLNGFVDDLYTLHKKRLKGREFYTTEEVGGYGGFTNDLEFYNKVNYYDSKSKQLLSTIKWEKKNPKNIHMIDLYMYDDQGRLKRNYSASYLPSRRISPLETLVTLHFYNNSYHSFREYDSSNIQVYEQCNDIADMKKTYIAYHYEDIPDSYQDLVPEVQGIYRACFDHTSSTAKPYISPLYELTEMKAGS